MDKEKHLSPYELNHRAAYEAYKSFMKGVHQRDVKSPFESYFNRDQLDGARPKDIVDAENPGRQKSDRDRVDAMVREFLFRPDRASTHVKGGTKDIPFRTPLTRVLKDFIRASLGVENPRRASINDYHLAMRYGSPLILITEGVSEPVALYAHLMCERWALEDEETGEIIDPRSYDGVKGVCQQKELDKKWIYTIRMPNLPYLKKMFAPSHYPANQKVNGAIHFEDMGKCEYFRDLIRALTLEVQRENVKSHPAMTWGGFGNNLEYSDNIMPMSPIDNGHHSSFGSETAFAISPVSKNFPSKS